MPGRESRSAVHDEPESRETAVRHAHAVEARRHGRAATPGYLGVPADQVVPAMVALAVMSPVAMAVPAGRLFDAGVHSANP